MEETREQLKSEIDSLGQKILQYAEQRRALYLAPFLKYVRFLSMSDCGNVAIVAENETTMPKVRESLVRTYRKLFPELGHLVLSSFYLTHDKRNYLFADDNARARDFSNSVRCYAVFDTTQSDLGEVTQEPETSGAETSAPGDGGILNMPWKHKLNIIVDSNFNNIVLLAELGATVMEVKELVARAHNQWCPEYGKVTVSSLYLRFPSGYEPAPPDDSKIGDSYPENTLLIELLVNFTAAVAGDLTQEGELTQERATCTAGIAHNDEAAAFRSDEGAAIRIPDAGHRESSLSRSSNEPILTQDAASYVRINQEIVHDTSVHLAHNSATANGALVQIPDGGGLGQFPSIEIDSIQDAHQGESDTTQNGARDLRWFLENPHALHINSQHVSGTNSGGLAHEMLQSERLPSELVIDDHNSEKKKLIMNMDLQDRRLVTTSEETDVFAKPTECLRASLLEHGNLIKELGSSSGDGDHNQAPKGVSHDMNVEARNEHRTWSAPVQPLSHGYDDENILMEELIPGPIVIEDGSDLDSTRKDRAAKSKRLSKQASEDFLESSCPSSERKRLPSGPFSEKSAEGSIPSSLRQVSQKEIAALNAMKGRKVLFRTSNGETIQEQDLLDLLNGKWANSEIINSYLHLIKLRADRKFHIDGTSSIRVYIYSSFFYTKYAREGYVGVSKWTKNINIFEFNLVLFPINHEDVHWALVGVDLQTSRISYYDSLRQRSSTRLYRSIMNSLAAYLDAHEPNNPHKWQQQIEDVPQQADGVSCGIYVCAYAELLARGMQPPFAFSATDTPCLRRGVAADILRAYIC